MAAENNLEAILKENGISVGILARRAGFKRSTIVSVSSSGASLAPSSIERIITALNNILRVKGKPEVSHGDVFPALTESGTFKLEAILTTKGIKKTDLAKKAGMASKTVSRALKGDNITATTAFKLKEALNHLLEERGSQIYENIVDIFPGHPEFAKFEKNL